MNQRGDDSGGREVMRLFKYPRHTNGKNLNLGSDNGNGADSVDIEEVDVTGLEGLFFFLNFIYLFGRIGSSLLHTGFL